MANLLEMAQRESKRVDDTKKEIVEEISQYFENYIESEQFELYIKDIINKHETAENKCFKLYSEFWAYHSGCGPTNFSLGNYRWYNPESEQYSIKSHNYKGIELVTIQDEILIRINSMARSKLEEFGFTYDNLSSHSKKNNCGYRENTIEVSWR